MLQQFHKRPQGKVFDQSITVTLKGLDNASSVQFNELMSEKTVAFVKDRNVDAFYFFGAYNGMTNNGVLEFGTSNGRPKWELH